MCAVFATSACLSQSHAIPRNELQILAQADPQARGQNVRVIQGFQGSEPPPAPRVDGSTQVSLVVVQPIGPQHHSHGGHGHGHGVGSIAGQSAKAAKDDGKALLILATIAAVGAALTEGMRYDGWVELHPMHPVHLYGWDGSYRWLPLAQVTPEVAAATRKAVVREGEGPWHTLGRAPLNRYPPAGGTELIEAMQR
jgi:hypothetical protein